MIIRLLKTMFKQSGQSIIRNRNMSLASVGSVSATLIILGLVLMLVLNMSNLTNTTKDDFDQVEAYVDLKIEQEEVYKVGEKIKKIKGVKSVQYVSKDQALENMKDRLEENEDILDGLEKNPFQNVYTVYLENVEEIDSVAVEVKKVEGIEDVRYHKDIVDKLISIADLTRIGGIILIGILLVISIFIISNTIKTTVMARQTEISIMKYVGATNGFIRGPFIIEGVVLGILGSLISIFIVMFGYKYLVGILNTALNGILSTYLIAPSVIFKDIIIIFITLGAGVGIVGSIISLRRFLKV